MNTPFQSPSASVCFKLRFFSIGALFVNLEWNKWDFKETNYDKTVHILTGEQKRPPLLLFDSFIMATKRICPTKMRYGTAKKY